MKKLFLAALLFGLYMLPEFAQAQGQFSGNFQSNTQFYVRDDRIGANTVQYRRQKSSTDAWLFMNYRIKGFSITARYDVFNNSALLNPQAAYTNSGLGYWQIKKSIGKLELTGGYFYDQFGSGVAFRAFEDRLIGIDYAVRGIHARYSIDDTWFIKAFTGQQKGFLDLNTGEDTRFGVTPHVIKGINTEKRFNIKENLSIDVGASIVNRTLGGNVINELVNEINGLPIAERFQPKSNACIYNGYFTLNWGRFAWFTEYTLKEKSALRNPFDLTKLYNREGKVLSTSLSYSQSGLGINLQYKRVENYQFRTSPNYILLNGLVTYLPSITRQNVYRLLARYTPAVQNLGENAYQADILWSPNKKLTMNFNFSLVNRLPNYDTIAYAEEDKQFFQEYYVEAKYSFSRKLKVALGFQYIFYNQDIYQLSPNAPNVEAYTPFTEITYKLTKRQSLRFEAQYLHTKQDLGSFVNATLEYNIAPHWSFSVGDMVNTAPVRTPETPQEAISDEIIHYYNFFVAYSHKNTRFTVNYLKQVQGVNCTGGICRVEPAFSGMRFGLTTNF